MTLGQRGCDVDKQLCRRCTENADTGANTAGSDARPSAQSSSNGLNDIFTLRATVARLTETVEAQQVSISTLQSEGAQVVALTETVEAQRASIAALQHEVRQLWGRSSSSSW